MYEKNLTEDLRLRLSSKDMDFLRDLSYKRSVSISECIRNIIGDYRRSFESSISLVNNEKEVPLSYGDTKTDFNDKL